MPLPVPTASGPAASFKWPSSLHPSNPYGFPHALLVAARLPVKTTDKYIFFFGYEGNEPEVCFQQWFARPFRAGRYPFRTKAVEGVQVYEVVDSSAKDSHGEGSVDSLAKKHSEMVDFPTAEHYMMYAKALLMNDTETAEKILRCEHPSEAKKLGREVQNFDQRLWDQVCDSVVRQGNLRKFGDERNKDLREVLVGTGERVIVEASPDDRSWGIGFDAETAAKMVEGEGREAERDWGRNKLGEALIWVRERLREEKESEGS